MLTRMHRRSPLAIAPWPLLCLLAFIASTGLGLAWADSATPTANPVQYQTLARIDPESGTLEVTTTFSMAVDPGQVSPIEFLFNTGLDIVSVSGEAVRSHRLRDSDFAPVWNILEVTLETPPDGERVDLEIQYAGRLHLAGSIGGISPEAVELSLETMWHPIPASLDQEMIGRLQLDLPPDWEVVGSAEVHQVDGQHHLKVEVPQLDVALFAAPTLSRWQEGSWRVYSQDAEDELAQPVLNGALACGAFLDARFGGNDPLPAVRIVLVDREEMALARKNFMVLPRLDPSDRIALHRLLCHELAHYWAVSPGPLSPEHWMSESFAEYVALLFLREQFGQAVYARHVAELGQSGRGQGPVWTPDQRGRPSHAAMYQLGPYLLSQLHEQIGEQAFAEFLRRQLQHRVRATADLLENLESIAGREARVWFEQALAGTDG
ncbi:MAG: hypothetical protein ACXIUM_11435 [Wenzhouxiangella sp.]